MWIKRWQKMAKKTSPEKEKKGNRRNEVFMIGEACELVAFPTLSVLLPPLRVTIAFHGKGKGKGKRE